MEWAEHRRPVLSRLPPGWSQLRTLSDQCQRSRGSATLPVLSVRPHPGPHARASGKTVQGASQDAGFAAGLAAVSQPLGRLDAIPDQLANGSIRLSGVEMM